MQNLIAFEEGKKRICLLLCSLLLLAGVSVSDAAVHTLFLQQQSASCMMGSVKKTLPDCEVVETQEGTTVPVYLSDSREGFRSSSMRIGVKLSSLNIVSAILPGNLDIIQKSEQSAQTGSNCFAYTVIRYIHQKDGRKRILA